jgi:hypothetical protein
VSNFDETGEAEQVEQDQVGRPAERAEQLRQGRDADSEMLMTDGGAADENAGAVDPAQPGGSGNASITEESSADRATDWQVNAEGTVRHAAGNTGANSAATDDRRAAEDFETRLGEDTVNIESGADNGLNE